MLGWMLIFTLMLLYGAFAALSGGIGAGTAIAFTVVSGFLLLISILTRALRGGA